MTEPVPPRVTSVAVKNYRALRDVTLTNLTPLTVLLGPNGSGKSTVFDVFAFLSECFTDGIRRAWDRRGRFRELRSRDSTGPIAIDLKYRERPRTPLITYHLEIDEDKGQPVVAREYLRWTRGGRQGRPFNFMEYSRGDGEVITRDAPERDDTRVPRKLSGPDVLAVNTLGMLAENPRVVALREFITSWHLSYLSADAARGNAEAGGEERLSQTGDNLANVVQHLHDQHPGRLDEIFEILRRRVPRIERVEAEVLATVACSCASRMPRSRTGALALRIGWNPQDACLSDAPARSGATEAHRDRRARELSPSATPCRARRGVPRRLQTHPVARYYPFPVLPRRATAKGSSRPLARRYRLHPNADRLGLQGGQRVRRPGRSARRPLDGGSLRCGRPLGQSGGAVRKFTAGIPLTMRHLVFPVEEPSVESKPQGRSPAISNRAATVQEASIHFMPRSLKPQHEDIAGRYANMATEP